MPAHPPLAEWQARCSQMPPENHVTMQISSSVLCRAACGFGCLLVLAGPEASAAPRARGEEIVRGKRAARGEVLVRLRPTSGRRALAEPAADIEADEPLGRAGWRLVRSRSRDVEELAALLASRADVAAVEPNYAVRLTGVPDDFAAPLWALQNTGQRLQNGDSGTPGADLDAVRAWDVTQGSRRIVIATIDTGVTAAHRDLAANLWAAPRSFTVTIGGQAITCPTGSRGFNVIMRTCDPADDHGHGTHVAGSLGAVGNNGSGVVGVNWTTSIMALKFMDAAGNGYVSDAMNAIEFALQVKEAFASTGDADIRVLNNSWTGGGYSQAMSDMIARAGMAGMLFVASAGNTGTDHEVTPVYPADYSGANVLTVAASDYRDQHWNSSDYGTRHVHVSAPGVLIYSTMWSAADPSGTYATLSGTSMAAAYASGVAALVLAHCPYTVGALRDVLIRTVDPIPALSTRVASGGRLDAAAAVRSCDAGPAAARDIVVRASDIPSAQRHGAWAFRSDGTAAGGVAIASTDAGWASTTQPLPQPVDYFDVSFTPEPGIPYRVWLRLKASADSKWNDSVWLQFSNALVNGAPAYGINSGNGLAINLEPCSNCGLSGWGWQDGAYWLARPAVVFGSGGTQTLRIQTREDGVSIDQIVISAATWLSAAPGQPAGDSTIVPRSEPGASGVSTPASTPYAGAAASLPATIQAEHFDLGSDGSAYHDADAVNNGGAFRSSGADIEATAGGGYNLGWVAPGEWLAYSVDVSAAGRYTAQFRVASYGPGGTFHLEANGVDLTGPLTVPDTGWWQTWTVLAAPVTLSAGPQVLRLVMDSAVAGAVGNFDWFAVVPVAAGITLPGRVLATQFDEGGEGRGYHDDSVGNAGGALRVSDVDIEACAEGGYNVGWIGAGEWLQYTVSVPATDTYTVTLRVASPDGGGSLRLAAGSVPLTSSIAVPRTGGWQAWTDVSVTVSLSAGTQPLRLLFDTGGFNIRHLDIVRR